MRVGFYPGYGQAVLLFSLIAFSFVFPGCRRPAEEVSVLPPVTNPLTREYIGYGVVNVSFAQLLSDPGTGAASRGYLRRGTVVRIIERRPVVNRNTTESWVLVEGNYQDAQGAAGPARGWLQETTLNIYDNEGQAETASKAMNQ